MPESLLQRIRARRRRRRPRRLLADRERGTLPAPVIEAIAREEGPGILARIGDALSLPGDVFRGAISGELGERVTARELLAKLGLEPEAEFDLTDPFSSGGLDRLGAGLGVLATDIFTDPLTLLAGVGQLGRTASTVDKARRAVESARGLARLGRAGRGGRQATRPLGRVGQFAQQTGREARGEIIDQIRAQRTRARDLLSSLPAGSQPSELFSASGVPQIQRLAGRRARPLPRGRELLTAGIPFTSARTRIPILPRRVEQALISPVAGALGGTRNFLRRSFGRGIPQETRDVLNFITNQRAQTSAVLGREIAREAEDLAVKRQLRTGGSLDDAMDALREDVRLVREGDKTVSLTQNERIFAKDLSAIVDGATEAQIATGARTDALIEDYAERILSPRGREALRVRGLQNDFRRHMNNRARIRDNSQIRRRDYLRDEFTTDVNDYFRVKIPELQGEDLFSLDPALTVEVAVRDRGMSVVLANLAQSLTADFAGMTGRAGDVPIAEFLASSGVKQFGPARWSQGGVQAVERALTAAEIDTAKTIPLEVAKEASDILGTLAKTTGGQWKNFLENVYDPIASLYRTLATSPFPGFHGRNMVGNVILNMLGGVVSPHHYARALKIMRNPAEIRRLERLGVVRGGEMTQLAKEFKRAVGPSGNRLQRALRPLGDNPITRTGTAVGNFTENFGRIAHFLGRKSKGATDLEAVQSVNKFLFDYGRRALAPAERGVANRLFFFYRWNRYALPLMLGQVFENPRRFAILGRLTTQPGTERPAGIPEFVREAAGIPGSVNPQTGETRFTTRFGSPFEVFSLVDPLDAVGAAGTIRETGREVAANLVPPLRAMLELVAGEEFFVGRDIEGLDQGSATGSRIGELISRIPGLEQVGRDIGEEVPTRRPGVTRNRRSPFVRFIMRNLPTARVTGTTSRLLDAIGETINQAQGAPSRQRRRRTVGPEILRTLAGVNFADVDTSEEAVNRFRRVLNRRAERERLRGNVGELEIPFITERGKQDRDTRELIEFLNRIRGRRRL